MEAQLEGSINKPTLSYKEKRKNFEKKRKKKPKQKELPNFQLDLKEQTIIINLTPRTTLNNSFFFTLFKIFNSFGNSIWNNTLVAAKNRRRLLDCVKCRGKNLNSEILNYKIQKKLESNPCAV